MFKRIICVISTLLIMIFIVGCDGNKVVTKDGRTNNDLKAEYVEAQKLLDEGKYEEAIKALDGIPDTYNKYSDVVIARANAIDLYIEDVIVQADKLSTENKYLDALELLEKAKTMAGDNPLIASREDQLKVHVKDEIFAEAESLYNQKEYEKTITLLTEAPAYVNDYSEVKELLINCSVEYSKEQVKALEDDGKNSEAIALLKQQIDLLGGNDVLQKMFVERLPEFKKNLLEESEDKFYSDGYSAAIGLLLEGERIIGADDDIDAKRSLFKGLKSKEPKAYSEDFASSQGGFFVKKGNDYFRLQRGGEYISDGYNDCGELNMACTDAETERIPVLTGESQLVVFSNSLAYSYHVRPIQEVAYTFPLGLSYPGDGTYWGHTFDKTLTVYCNDCDTIEMYDIGAKDPDGITIEEIDGMSYEEYWDAFGFNTGDYCIEREKEEGVIYLGSWGTKIIKYPKETTVKFSYYRGTNYCEDEMTSSVKFYGFNGFDDEVSSNYEAKLGKTSYATIDVSDLSSGLYVLYEEYKDRYRFTPKYYIFEKR